MLAFWRHGSNAVLGLGVLLVAGLEAAGVWRTHVGMAVLGAALFLGSEYVFHRFAFHAPPVRAWVIRKLQHRLHYDHHVEPARLDLLFLPLWFVLPNLALTGAVGWLIWPGAAHVGALLAGVCTAILYYEWVHYTAHIPYQPRTGWGRWMKKYHLWHHFKNKHLWFGVTNPGFDLMLRSYARVEEAPRSATVRDLGR